MQNFNRNLFETSGEYLFYPVNGKRTFVARFKHNGPFTKAKFLKELIANHTVESYFLAMEQGKAPLTILKDMNEDWFFSALEKFSGKNFREAA
jgi:hypothetical protein